MRPDPVPPYVAGDRLDDGRGSQAFVNAYTAAGSGRVYLKARFVSGPRRGQSEWPEKVGLPLIDWDKTGNATVCVECDRSFKAHPDVFGAPRIWCRTCDAVERKQAAQRGGEPSHGFGAQRGRIGRR